jgi:hypothetical protein
MIVAGQMKARVESVIRTADPKAITATFYDDASDRLFVTIIKGSRKISVTLRGGDFSNGAVNKIEQAIKDGLRRLQSTPIG